MLICDKCKKRIETSNEVTSDEENLIKHFEEDDKHYCLNCVKQTLQFLKYEDFIIMSKKQLEIELNKIKENKEVKI